MISSPKLDAAAASAGAADREELDKKQRGRAGNVLHSFSVCGVCEGYGGFFLSLLLNTKADGCGYLIFSL